MDLSTIKPYPNNAKEHPEAQVALIAHSLRKWGWRQPIVVNDEKVIIAGHGRFLAWQSDSSIKTPWIIDESGVTLNGAPEATPFESEEDEKAYRLADNQLNAMSGYESEILIPELRELDTAGVDITLLGFNYDIITEENDQDDVLPETPIEPKSKLGDVYEIGAHKVICGDSLDEAVWNELMGTHKGDMLFTDPPYNVNYKGSGENTSEGILNDKMDDASFLTFLTKAFKHVRARVKGGGGMYVFHSPTTQAIFEQALEANGLEIKTQLIWNKPSAGLGMGDYRSKHEPFFYASVKGDKPTFYGDRTNTTVVDFQDSDSKLLAWAKIIKKLEKEGRTTIWTMKRDRVDEYQHPTQKPIELIIHALHNSSKVEDLIVDPFLGSGSTLIAAEKSSRICFGIELDPKYVDVIVQRWVDYTGCETIKLNGQSVTWPKTDYGTINDPDSDTGE